ncbi:MAG: hypothetical protein HQ457_00915, partial [Betaproteobacteria bacterium]|nr:hypothetical protein [Betaproteobacteria bacterium]
MNQNVSPLTSKLLASSSVVISPLLAKNTAITQSHTANLLIVLANGSGDELFTKNDLRVIGAHPFSESTRRRKIKSGDYPPPLMLSEQMGLWTLRSIRFFLIDPATYKVRSSQ